MLIGGLRKERQREKEGKGTEKTLKNKGFYSLQEIC
jgi:hypothetical protein